MAGGTAKECELEQIMYSHEDGFSTNPVTYEVKGGKLNITPDGIFGSGTASERDIR